MENTETEKNNSKKLVYICAPYRGNSEAETISNVNAAKQYCRFAMNLGRIPFCAHLALCGFLDDSDPEERAAGIEAGKVMLGLCGEIWIFGTKITDGMKGELEEALKFGLPIRSFPKDAGCGDAKIRPPRTIPADK